MKNKKNKYVIGFSSICALIFILLFFKDYISQKPEDEDILHKIYKLPTSYTMEEAIEDGFLDITQVLPKKSNIIENFIQFQSENEINYLKTAKKLENDFTLDLYVSYKQQPYFTLYSYSIKAQTCTVSYFAKEIQSEKHNGQVDILLKSLPDPRLYNIVNTSDINSDSTKNSLIDTKNTIDISTIKADFILYSYIAE